jgi:selenocysteine lyase/cysteine desulfurase
VREARESVLAFFRAPPEYTVVFTANATSALKLVGESFPFTKNGTYVLGADSHNSLHGIREFSYRAGSHVAYIESTPRGGLDESFAKVIVLQSKTLFLVTEPQITVCINDAPAAFERECEGFVCPHWDFEHFQQ